MNPWWLMLIMPATFIAGAIGLLLFAWFTRNVFPLVFTPDDW